MVYKDLGFLRAYIKQPLSALSFFHHLHTFEPIAKTEENILSQIVYPLYQWQAIIFIIAGVGGGVF
jgi:hypothetical protein